MYMPAHTVSAYNGRAGRWLGSVRALKVIFLTGGSEKSITKSIEANQRGKKISVMHYFYNIYIILYNCVNNIWFEIIRMGILIGGSAQALKVIFLTGGSEKSITKSIEANQRGKKIRVMHYFYIIYIILYNCVNNIWFEIIRMGILIVSGEVYGAATIQAMCLSRLCSICVYVCMSAKKERKKEKKKEKKTQREKEKE